MKANAQRIIYWSAALAIVALILLLAFLQRTPQKKLEEGPVSVEVETVSTGSIEEIMQLTGWIRAEAVVDVSSKVGGRLESLKAVAPDGGQIDVEEGLAVSKGQQIAVIDRDVYLAQANAARANVKAMEVTLADAEREKNRMTALFQGGSATEQAKDKAVTAAQLAAAQLDAAKANLDLAEINLRESLIVSPIDGVVTAKHIDQGNLIRVGDRIVTVEDTQTTKIVVPVSEKYAGKVKVGTKARITVDAWPDKIFEAQVHSVYPALDAQTHTIQVEIRLNNDAGLLKPAMLARVALVTDKKDNVIVIPRDVVLGGKIDDHYAYVVNDRIAHKRIVKVGIAQADRCEIIEGLSAGETLVVNGMHYVTDGAPVEVTRLEDVK